MTGWQFLRWWTGEIPFAHRILAVLVETVAILAIAVAATSVFAGWAAAGFALGLYALHVAVVLGTLSDKQYQQRLRELTARYLSR